MSTDPFTTPVATVRDLIAAAPFFGGRTVATEEVGDITAILTNALAKLGLAVAVLVPDAGDGQDKGYKIEQTLRIVIEVSELVLVNKTQPGGHKPALSAVREVIKAIHRKPNGLDPAGAMHRAGLNEITVDLANPFQRRPHKAFLVYHVYAFTTVLY